MMVEVVEAQTALNGGLSFDFTKTEGASKWVTINTEKQFELRGSNVNAVTISQLLYLLALLPENTQ